MSRELLLLGLLRRWSTYPYQLNEFLEERLAFLADIKRPTAYALLERLRREGHVRVEREREGNLPERRVYHVTSAGETHFARLLRENLGHFAPPYFPDAIGLYFLDELPDDEARQLLQERLTAVEARLTEFRARVAGHQGLAVQPVLAHYLTHLEADRAFLEELLRSREEATMQGGDRLAPGRAERDDGRPRGE